jgi:5-methyltetrahydropteroyltriglutamate--homocysteine methyltransferase
MKRSEKRFLTTHVGRLGHDAQLVKAMAASPDRRPEDPEFHRRLAQVVNDAVDYQVGLGIDSVCDGEHGKLGWMVYHRQRLSGFAIATPEQASSRLGLGKDFRDFAEYYHDESQNSMFRRWSAVLPHTSTACVGPVKYIGQADLQEDIATLKAAVSRANAMEGFMNATSPSSVMSPNFHYSSDEEYLFALADALNEEYRAITAAGLVLQIDDPTLVDHWGALVPNIDLSSYHKWAELRIEAVNRALRGVPRELTRLHVCWGSWHGPHSTDLPMKDAIGLLLRINVGGFSVEAANARHEHEFAVWKGAKLDGRVLLPGVVGHTTDTIEHPELVAWRIGLWADAVGRENVIASTDCGLGDRVHPQIERAKFASLVEGARLASTRFE